MLGSAGALYIMPLLVAVSTFGATNGATFLAGRLVAPGQDQWLLHVDRGPSVFDWQRDVLAWQFTVVYCCSLHCAVIS